MMQVQLDGTKALRRVSHIFFFYCEMVRVIICDSGVYHPAEYYSLGPNSLPLLGSTLLKCMLVLLLRRRCFKLQL